MSETPDQATMRRRWITLAEVVAVSGVIIGALSLWITWSDKRAAVQEKAVATAAAQAAEARFALRAEVADDDQVRLSDPVHEILETDIGFPASLGIARQAPATPRIDRNWFAAPLLKATDGGADEREGRLPVLVTARYRVGESLRQGHAIVEVVWRTHGRLIGGRSLTIEAARVRERGGNAARIEALWQAELKRQRSRA